MQADGCSSVLQDSVQGVREGPGYLEWAFKGWDVLREFLVSVTAEGALHV